LANKKEASVCQLAQQFILENKLEKPFKIAKKESAFTKQKSLK